MIVLKKLVQLMYVRGEDACQYLVEEYPMLLVTGFFGLQFCIFWITQWMCLFSVGYSSVYPKPPHLNLVQRRCNQPYVNSNSMPVLAAVILKSPRT